MKANLPLTEFSLWRNQQLFNIDFASYRLSHHHFSRHFHDHYVIELVLNGADKFYCDGNDYTANPGELVLINPGEVHTGNTVNDTPLQYFSLYPDKKTLQDVAAVLHITLPADLDFQTTLVPGSVLTEKLRVLHHSLRSNEPLLQLEEKFFDCMQHLLQFSSAKEIAVRAPQARGKDLRISQLIAFIRSHFKEELSLQQMAALVNLNPFHLIRLFKKTIGVSPYDYLLICRTEYAKQLLRSGNKVQDAALEAGFYDASHFNRSFRKLAGMSPKSFLLSKGQYRTIFSA